MELILKKSTLIPWQIGIKEMYIQKQKIRHNVERSMRVEEYYTQE